MLVWQFREKDRLFRGTPWLPMLVSLDFLESVPIVISAALMMGKVSTADEKKPLLKTIS